VTAVTTIAIFRPGRDRPQISTHASDFSYADDNVFSHDRHLASAHKVERETRMRAEWRGGLPGTRNWC